MPKSALFLHYQDSVQCSCEHDPRLKRSPSMRRGKKRGYLITAAIVVVTIIVVIAGVILS